jgi:hypothetical protein
MNRSGLESRPDDVADTASGPTTGVTLERPELSGLQAATRKALDSGARAQHGAGSSELLLPPNGPPDSSYSDVAMQRPPAAPFSAPSQDAVDDRVRAAQLADRRRLLASPRNTPPIPSAQKAMQQYVDTSRANASVRQALRPDTPADTTILPGEEQVTTRDVLRSLSPQEQSALQAKFDKGGLSGTMGYDDWLSENFGDLPPDQRSSAMRTVAGSTPRINLGSDPTLPEGVNSTLADGRRAAGLPLPEGREPKQYSKEQSRTMSRNVYNPEVPMGRFGGTFTLGAGGAMSSRAPAPDAVQQAAAIAADQGEGSPSHVLALAQAYGIDVHKYGDDMDMLTADTLREHERHSERAAKHDTIATGMGGFRYTPNKGLKDRMAALDRERFARTLTNRFQGLQGQADGQSAEELLAAASTASGSENGKDEMVRMGQKLRRIREGNQHQAARNRAQNYNLSRDMTGDSRGPAFAPGMAVRSLMEAVRSGNPEMTAAVHDVYGNPAAAAQNRQLAMMQAQSANAAEASVADRAHEVELAEIRAKGDSPEDAPALGDQQQKEMERIRAIENPTEKLDALQSYVEKVHPEWAPDQVDTQVRKLMASIQARASAAPLDDEFVRQHLDSMRNNKPMFMLYATQELKLTPPQAEALYQSGNTPTTARQVGQAAGAFLPNAAAGALNLGRGFASGVVSGATGGK